MTTGELAAAAERILYATIEKIVQPDPTRYGVEVHLRVAETLKGKVEGERFVFRLHGGVVNGIGLISSEDPRLEVGKPVIVFLQNESLPRAPVVGGKQGCLHVRNGQVVEKRVPVNSFLATVRAKVAEEAAKARPHPEERR